MTGVTPIKEKTLQMKSNYVLIAFAAVLSMVGQGAAQVPAAKTAEHASPTAKTKAAEPTSAPTAQEIADAKAKGMVWVNTATKVYHTEGPSYGATKKGKFMTEDDAKKAGFHAAKEPVTKKAPAAAKK